MNSKKIYRQIILFQRIYYLSISLTGLPCHREPSIVLMSMSKGFFNSSKLMTNSYSSITRPPSRSSVHDKSGQQVFREGPPPHHHHPQHGPASCHAALLGNAREKSPLRLQEQNYLHCTCKAQKLSPLYM